MKQQTILFIHQSSELYGSDKTLLYLVETLKKDPAFNPIVILPNQGPLVERLKKTHIKVHILPVLKVSRKMFKASYFLKLPIHIYNAVKQLDKVLLNESIDFIHSNTLAVLLGAFYAKHRKIKHLWHIHEIIENPKIVSYVYPILVDVFAQLVVFNSEATKESLCNKRLSIRAKSYVVPNGLDRLTDITSKAQVQKIRKQILKTEASDVLIGLVGRINRWKGQLLLLEAFKILSLKYSNLKLVFIGSPPPGQPEYQEELLERIISQNLDNRCKVLPFTTDIWSYYDSLDMLIVPSTEPEPFGLVTIEGMLSKKLVIASHHGGPSEIIEHLKTGLLFKPNDIEDLAKSIMWALENEDAKKKIVHEAYNLAKTKYSLSNYVNSFKELYLH
jgi:glycosyltransferase involved in cell wall biosynthesis